MIENVILVPNMKYNTMSVGQLMEKICFMNKDSLQLLDKKDCF